MRISIKKLECFFLLGVLFIMLSITIGIFSIIQMNHIAETLMGEKALAIATTMKYQIDGDKFEKLAKNKDPDDPYYIQMQKLFSAIRDETGCTYLYSMAKNNDTEFYYVICEDHTLPGLTEDVSTYDPLFLNAMEKGISGFTNLEKDKKYGTLLSAVVPIKNTAGKVVGILACDFLASEVYKKTVYVRYGLLTVAAVMLLISCITTYFVIKAVFDRINETIETGHN